jgi:CheY-like chemotaxis protein
MTEQEQGSAPAVMRAGAILIVDDNAGKRLALTAALSPLGLTVVEAESGLEALRCLLAQDFALILLDIRMPIMDGFVTAGLIRTRQRSEKTPIIFVSAHEGDEVRTVLLHAVGAVDFIAAPFEPEELRTKVTMHVRVVDLGDLADQPQEVVHPLAG